MNDDDTTDERLRTLVLEKYPNAFLHQGRGTCVVMEKRDCKPDRMLGRWCGAGHEAWQSAYERMTKNPVCDTRPKRQAQGTEQKWKMKMICQDDDTIVDGEWLRSLGAIRPMAVAAETVYVLGDYRHEHDGCYPLLFTNRLPVKIAGLMLLLYGVPIRMDVTRGDVRKLCQVLRIELKGDA